MLRRAEARALALVRLGARQVCDAGAVHLRLGTHSRRPLCPEVGDLLLVGRHGSLAHPVYDRLDLSVCAEHEDRYGSILGQHSRRTCPLLFLLARLREVDLSALL